MPGSCCSRKMQLLAEADPPRLQTRALVLIGVLPALLDEWGVIYLDGSLERRSVPPAVAKPAHLAIPTAGIQYISTCTQTTVATANHARRTASLLQLVPCRLSELTLSPIDGQASTAHIRHLCKPFTTRLNGSYPYLCVNFFEVDIILVLLLQVCKLPY